MKGKMKKVFKTLIVIIAILATVIVTVSISRKSQNSQSVATLEQSVDKMEKTGNTATIKWKRNLGSAIDKFAKNGTESYDLYCAQRGASISSSGASYQEVVWNSDAGIWRSYDAYQKISWLKSCFWEDYGYTNEERLAILNTVDSSVTLSDVASVWGSDQSRYKVYQYLTWIYVNGNNPPTSYLSYGAESKVYNAIVALVNKNYKDSQYYLSITKQDDGYYDESTNSYVWHINVYNTSPLRCSLYVYVDGNQTTNCTYNHGELRIYGVGAGNHTFTVYGETAYVNSTASIWYNSSKQKFIEITSSSRVRLRDSVSTSVTATGKFSLNIKKVDEDGNPVSGATFKVNNVELGSATNASGIVSIENMKEISSQKETYRYTISEISSGGALSKLTSDVTITLSSGLMNANGNGYSYAITDARFDATGSNTMKAFTENGIEVTLTLETSFIPESGLTTVTVVIPNTKRIYDLALTKTMIVPSTEFMDSFDVNRNGSANAADATMLLILAGPYEVNEYNTIQDRYKAVYDKIKNCDGYEAYYKYLIDESLPENDYNRYKGIYDRLKQFVYDINGDENGTMAEAADKVLSASATAGSEGSFSRINGISSYDLARGVTTTATYDMNKTLRKVSKTDVITYRITVYNEGDYDSKDIEVTDYLPQGLKVCDKDGNTTVTDGHITCTYKGTEYVWSVNGNEAKIVINDTIHGFESDKVLKSKSVFITCVLDENVQTGKALYNVAEISNSTPIDSEGNTVNVKDRDSHEDSIENDTNNNVTDTYKDMFERFEVENGGSRRADKTSYDYEDDDDFERIIIVDRQFDLSLRKSITKVGTDEQNMEKVPGTGISDEGEDNKASRLPKLTAQSVDACRSTGTAEYYHGKTHVQVKANDYVEYTIRVYNEGRAQDYNGYAKQITDYLPENVNFVAVVDADGSWVTTKTEDKYVTTNNKLGHYEVTYDESNNKVIIDCVKTPKLLVKDCLNEIYAFSDSSMQTYYNGGDKEASEVNYGFQEVRIICQVSEDAPVLKNLTNIAEITDDVAYSNGNDVIEIDDADSTPSTIAIGNESGKINLDTYYDSRNVNDTYVKYYPGNQDDDDFETIYVMPEYQPTEYKLLARKIDKDGNGLQGAKFSLKKNNSNNLFENDGAVSAHGYTSEYKETISASEVEERYAPQGTREFKHSYVLTEEQAPEGYSKLANPIEIEYNLEVKGEGSVIKAVINTIDVYADNRSKTVSFNYEDDKNSSKKIEDVLLESGKKVSIIITLDEDGRIEVQVENNKLNEGDYTIYLKKVGTDGVQLGGVQFEATGYFNGDTTGVAIPSAGNKLVSSASDYVAVMPSSDEVITIEPDHYETADYIVLKEIGLASDAKDENGNAVDGKYYLGLKDKVIKVTFNKDVDTTTDVTKNVYYVKSIKLEVDGTVATKVSDTKYTYTDTTTGAAIAVELDTESKRINITVTNPKVDEEGSYSVKLIKYKEGSTTPVAGVKFTASAVIDGESVSIADADHPLTTQTTAIFVKENAEMSEEKIDTADSYTLKEVDVGSNSDIYIGYTGNIVLNVKKTMDTTDPKKKVYKVDEISLNVNGENVTQISKTKSSITIDEKTKIEVEFNTSSNVIEIRVTDPLKEGKFKLNLIKYKNVNGQKSPLAGAKFKVTINDGTSDIKSVDNQVTDSEGKIPEISNIPITAEDLTYTITVEETGTPEGYIGLGAPVTFTATSKFENGKYSLVTKEKAQLSNKFVMAEVKEDEIVIEAENRVEPVIHKGVKTVENQDSGYDKNEIQNWVINTTVPTGIEDYTKYIVTDTIDPEKTNIAEKRIAFIGEDHPENNVVVKYKGTNTTLTEGTDYKVAFDKTAKKLTITFINATEDANNFVGGRNLTDGTTLEITYNTQFTLDENGVPIGLNQSIPNTGKLTYSCNGNQEVEKESETPEVHTGGLGVFKYDKSTNKALEGAKFRLTTSKTEAEKAIAALKAGNETTFNNVEWVKKYNEDGSVGDVWEVTTNADGYAYFAGLEFGEDAKDKESNKTNNGVGGTEVYEYDWETASTTYYLVETYVPTEYILLDEIAAESEVKKNSFVVTDLTTYHKVGNDKVTPEGEYNVEIIKYGKKANGDTVAMPGVVFSAKRTINGGNEENLGNLTATDSTGKVRVGSTVTIDKDKVSINDVYKIQEVSVPENSEFYVGLNKEIVLTVSKQSVKSNDGTKFINSVKGIKMEISGENVTEVTAGKKYTAKVVKNGQELEIVAELVETDAGQTVKLTVENPHKESTFTLNIIKTIKGTGTPAKPLPGAGFKVSIKNGDEFVKDGNGNSIDGTHEYFADREGKITISSIDITKPGLTFNVEVEESTVPEGYIGISDKFTYTVTSALVGDELSLQPTSDVVVLSNDVKYVVRDGEIWNYVENKPEPVIHKGVRSVRNQDAGYDGDEIQTWVINSTVPSGIDDYVKYVITDTIDPEKTNNEEKRIEFIGLDSLHVKLIDSDKELVNGEDYVATFNEETKELKIVFIDGEFKKGQELPENSTIEIKYNTKFRLDENGLIIGLQQTVKNKAKLTYGTNPNENLTKESETPEVHTGAVGVFKFEDTNKNGKYDDGEPALQGAHFKIARTKEDADKALAAVLANDKEALSKINFVKVRDAEGKVTDKDVELITGKDGKATYQGLEFGENAERDGVEPTPDGKEGFLIYRYKDEWKDISTKYYLIETESPENYSLLNRVEEFVVSMDSYEEIDLTTYCKIPNTPKIYDLSLRKFITHVQGDGVDKEITNRIPQVTLTDDFKSGKVTTAMYEHTKEPVVVQQGNTVTYTIRVYNEGPEDAYATLVKDDIPDGVEFITYTEGDGSVNDKYRWKLLDENDNPVDDMSKAKYIVTDYLSMEQGKVKDGVNENLLKAFNSETMTELDYRDVKVQFKVIEPNTSERILINYAQISKMTDGNGKVVKDRDSTPNVWIDGEDDQDIEKIKLLYFDLALRKWVTKAIVTQDGQERVFETGHHAEDDPEDVVKVDLKKSKLDKVVVKFEYQIRITNEGKIGGWCDEIKDHIPDGLTFDQEDNPIWVAIDDKTITTDALKDTYLEPGESAEVTVVLRWINSGENLGIKINIAEISKDRNDYGAPDIDSTPNNYKWGEDDIDDAPVMLAVKTGDMILGYTILGVAIISIIALGVSAVRKVRKV